MVNVNELVRICQVNHNTLVNRLNSKQGAKLVDKWVAVTKKKIFVDSNSKKALAKARKIEPDRKKVLLTKVSSKDSSSIRF